MRTVPVYSDVRGSFMEIFKGTKDFVQANLLNNRAGTFRGFHYQMDPHAQGKLVVCVSGLIIDFFIDLRKGSKEYGLCQWVTLNEQFKQIYIPPGFAHGIYSPDRSTVIYFTTNVYNKSASRGINWKEPSFNLKDVIHNPILSETDKCLPMLEDAENNYEFKK